MIRLLTKQLKRHRSGLTQAVALFFGATILIATIGRTKATALRLTPPPAAAGDGGLFSFSGDDWLVNLMLAAVAFAGTTSLLFVCAKRSRGNSDRITRATKVHTKVCIDKLNRFLLQAVLVYPPGPLRADGCWH